MRGFCHGSALLLLGLRVYWREQSEGRSLKWGRNGGGGTVTVRRGSDIESDTDSSKSEKDHENESESDER